MLNACGDIHTQVGMPNVSMLESETPMLPSLTSSVATNILSCSFCKRAKKSLFKLQWIPKSDQSFCIYRSIKTG